MLQNITPMVKNLLLINIGVFVIAHYVFPTLQMQLALFYVESYYFRPYQLLTHMFMHADWGHLFGNMFGLFIFGPMLEKVFGSNKFLVFYLVCALGASVLYSLVQAYQYHELKEAVEVYASQPSPERFSTLISEHFGYDYPKLKPFMEKFRSYPNDVDIAQESIKKALSSYYKALNVPLVGASGAIFGILMAFALLFPNLELMLLFFPFPIKAKYLVAFYGAYELYSEIVQTPGDNVAHLAHLGGMLFAFILVKVWRTPRIH